MLLLTGLTVGAPPAVAEAQDPDPDQVTIDWLRQFFGVTTADASDDDLAAMLDGPQGDTLRLWTTSARVGATLHTGEDALRTALLGVSSYQLATITGYFEDTALAIGDAVLEGVIGHAASFGSIVARQLLSELASAEARIDHLVDVFVEVALSQEQRAVLETYAWYRLGGRDPAAAYAQAGDDLTAGFVANVADALQTTEADYAQTLEAEYQLLRFTQDQQLVADLHATIVGWAELLRAHGTADLVALVPKGPTALMVGNRGPIDLVVEHHTAGGAVTTEPIGPDSPALLSLPAAWAPTDEVRIHVQGIGTLTTTVNALTTSLAVGRTIVDVDDRTVEASTSWATQSGDTTDLVTTWDFDDGTTTTAGAPQVPTTHTYACPGSHDLLGQVTDGTTTRTLSHRITIADPFDFDVVADRDFPIPPDVDVQFSLDGPLPAGATVDWTVTDHPATTGPTTTARFASAGSEYVTATVTAPDGCAYSRARYVPVDIPVVHLARTISRDLQLQPFTTYVVNPANTTIPEGVTVTAGEGTVIKADRYDLLVVDGTLDLHGTATHPVVATSVDDDSAGGDIGNDGQSTTIDPWSGIRVNGTLTATHARISHGPVAVHGTATLAGVELTDTGVVVELEDGSTLVGTDLTTPGTVLASGTGTTVHVDGLDHTGSGYALQLSRITHGHAHDLTTTSTTPIYLGPGSAGVALTAVDAPETAVVRVAHGTFAQGVTTLGGTDLPYLFLRQNNYGHTQTVPAGGHLQLLPGVDVRFVSSGRLTVEDGGRLTLGGTASAPVSLAAVDGSTWSGLTAHGTVVARHADLSGPSTLMAVRGVADIRDSTLTGTVVAEYGGRVTMARSTSSHGVVTGSGAASVDLIDHTYTETGTAASLTVGTASVEGLSAPGSPHPITLSPITAGTRLVDIDAADGAVVRVAYGTFPQVVTTLGGTDLPYLFLRQNNNGATHTVPDGADLAVEPGVEIRFVPLGRLTVAAGGRLALDGTAAAPVTLAPEATGTWAGLTIAGTLDATRARIDGASQHTVTGTATFRHSHLLDRITASGSGSVDAIENWWGAADGPAPTGTGSPVSAGVAHEPWCADPDCNQLLPTTPLAVDTTTLPEASTGLVWTTTLTASGGTPPYGWTITDGQLPDGIVLDPTTGELSGRPTTAGTTTVDVTVTDTAPTSATATLQVTVVEANHFPAVTTNGPWTVPAGATVDLTATGTDADDDPLVFTWDLDGTQPTGSTVTFDSTGRAVDDRIPVSVEACDPAGACTDTTSTITVVAPVTITDTTLPDGRTGEPYAATLTADGGHQPHVWSVTTGQLPAGLDLTDDSTLTGTPLTAGTHRFEVTVTDATGLHDTAPTAIVLTPPLGTPGDPYTVALHVDGATGCDTWAVTDGTLPPGLALDAGTIEGTPTVGGDWPFEVTCSGPAGTTTAAFVITVAPDSTPPTVTGTPDRTPDPSGWYTGPVTITWTATDDSGAAVTPPPPVVVDGDGADQQVRSEPACDPSGNCTLGSVAVSLDATPPQVDVTVSPAANDRGWHTTAPTIGHACHDAVSGVETCPADVTVTTDGGGQEVVTDATDRAGNTTTTVTAVAVDTVPPTLVLTAHDDGAIVRDVDEVPPSCAATDTTSTVDGTCRVTVTRTPADPGSVDVVAVATVSDVAGNTTTETRRWTVVTDADAPTITAAFDRQPNGAGWHAATPTVAFQCDDPSGVTTCPAPHAFDVDGPNQSVAVEATDRWGNTAALVVSGVNVDTTPPTVVFTGAEDTYTVADRIEIGCDADDATSGVAVLDCEEVDTLAAVQGPGQHTVTARAVDTAGHETVVEHTYTVTVLPADVGDVVDVFLAADDRPGNQGQANALRGHIDAGRFRQFVTAVERLCCTDADRPRGNQRLDRRHADILIGLAVALDE
ncbi:hypothetical protein DVS28_a2891 [Euzebya pacifica]|uniref:PKD domain-containing protein n=1 Tax=Euzebya pacifica TaxID=1608957 RepID=A0A346XZC3_9ACTN|nr:putative Ig domain-containing protein [Euzebya pacifica]AXV07570.1 hypothetical protein DVS28_a2891 [Euzebya pacifica]